MIAVKWFGGLGLCLMLAAVAVLPAQAAAPSAAPLTWDALANAEYTVQLGEEPQQVKLVDGKYEEKTGPGASEIVTLEMDRVYAVGDLNGDDAPDAAVILGYNTGGSGVFYDLAAVLNESGKPVYAASAPLGDRSVTRTAVIRAGKIEIELLTAGPSDPACCPTNKVVRTYGLKGKELTQAAELPIGKSRLPFLTWNELANAEYPTSFVKAGKVQLKDGGYEATVAGGVTDTLQIQLDYGYATGDLTGSGALDAAVLLVANPHQDNEAYELAAVLNQNGKPVSAVPLPAGARVQGLTIEANRIVANLLTLGPADKAGSPSQKVTQTYQVKAGKLVATTQMTQR